MDAMQNDCQIKTNIYNKAFNFEENNMASTVDELTINYEEDGVQVTKELDKEILTKGAWATVIFRYQDWDRKKEAYGPDRYTIRRYQKKSGEYKQKSKFNISSKDQALAVIAALQKWTQDAEG